MSNLESRKQQAKAIVETLGNYYEDADTTLNYKDNPWRLLVGAILAAQCTDARVNKVTPALFERFPEIPDFAATTPEAIEPYIKSCGLFRNKAKSIRNAAVHILEQHNAVVPSTEAELLAVPGVGRKIANLLIGDAFGGQAVVVDTHCARITQLMGLSDSKNVTRIEKDLMALVPQDRWTDWGHLLVILGRDICIARRPQCQRCPVQDLCDYGRKQKEEAEAARAQNESD